jgi:hypothetical protein
LADLTDPTDLADLADLAGVADSVCAQGLAVVGHVR